MEQKQFVYEDLNSLDDESLTTVLSSCPYRLLALALKATPEEMRDRMLSLLSANKKRLVLDDHEQLDLEKLNLPHDSIMEEVEAAQRTIVRSARVLLEDGQIQLAGYLPSIESAQGDFGLRRRHSLSSVRAKQLIR